MKDRRSLDSYNIRLGKMNYRDKYSWTFRDDKRKRNDNGVISFVQFYTKRYRPKLYRPDGINSNWIFMVKYWSERCRFVKIGE